MTEQLLQLLQKRANHRGLVLARASVLQEALRCSFQELKSMLRALAETRAVEIFSPLPFLILALKGPAWSGMKGNPAEIAPQTGPAPDRAYSFQSSLSPSKQLKESYRQPAEDETLLQDILETLGETDPTTFRGAIRSYPAGVIRTALARIRRMKSVRKNRTALFRFLLPRIAKGTSSFN